MLTSALRILDKKLKVATLSCKLCVQGIERLKRNFFYMKFHNYFLFWNLRALVSITRSLIGYYSRFWVDVNLIISSSFDEFLFKRMDDNLMILGLFDGKKNLDFLEKKENKWWKEYVLFIYLLFLFFIFLITIITWQWIIHEEKKKWKN